MKKSIQACVGLLLSMSLVFASLSGCEQQGPAERAGEALDEATEEAKEDLGEAKENLEEAVEGMQEATN